jgi:hypothetical protein
VKRADLFDGLVVARYASVLDLLREPPEHLSAYARIRQQTPAYVSRRSTSTCFCTSVLDLLREPPEHLSAYARIRPHTSADTSMRQPPEHLDMLLREPVQLVAYVSIREHT